MAIVITLAVVGGLLALDRTVLHIYYQDDSEPIPTRTPRPTATPDTPLLTADEVAGLVRDSPLAEPLDLGVNGVVRTVGELAFVTCDVSPEVAEGMMGIARFSATYDGNGRWLVDAPCLTFPIGGGQSTSIPVNAGRWSYLEQTGQIIRR